MVLERLAGTACAGFCRGQRCPARSIGQSGWQSCGSFPPERVCVSAGRGSRSPDSRSLLPTDSLHCFTLISKDFCRRKRRFPNTNPAKETAVLGWLPGSAGHCSVPAGAAHPCPAYPCPCPRTPAVAVFLSLFLCCFFPVGSGDLVYTPEPMEDLISQRIPWNPWKV